MKTAEADSCDNCKVGSGGGGGGDAKGSTVADSLFIPRGARGALVCTTGRSMRCMHI